MLLLDTSAYINGQRDHYPVATFPSVWDLVTEAMSDGRIVPPREVFRELTAKDDDIAEWAKERAGLFLDRARRSSAPSAASTRCSPLAAAAVTAPTRSSSPRRRRAASRSPRTRGAAFSGVPTRNWEKTMPGICRHFGVPCRTLPEALTMIGARF